MKTNRIAVGMILAGLFTIGAAGEAMAHPRSPKPVVCATWTLVEDADADGRTIAVCPTARGNTVLRYWTEMTINAPDGPATVIVGYR